MRDTEAGDMIITDMAITDMVITDMAITDMDASMRDAEAGAVHGHCCSPRTAPAQAAEAWAIRRRCRRPSGVLTLSGML
jgi:hypothetical protein